MTSKKRSWSISKSSQTKTIEGLTFARMLSSGKYYSCCCIDTVEALLANEEYKHRIFECYLYSHGHSKETSIYLIRVN